MLTSFTQYVQTRAFYDILNLSTWAVEYIDQRVQLVTSDDGIPISKYVAVLILVTDCIELSAFVGGCIYNVFVSYLKTLTVAQQVSYIHRIVE